MSLNAPPWKGPATNHFDGRFFHNPTAREHHFLDAFRWMVTRQPEPWPPWVDLAPAPPPPARVDGDEIRVTLINHSTVLIQTGGVNVLTDPIWSNRCSPFAWAGPRRHKPPGIRFGDLPDIDLVLVSHNHYDHMDVPTLRRLHETHHPRVVTTLGNSRFLANEGMEGARDMDWWDEADEDGVHIVCTPTEHFSGRGPADRNTTLWGSFLVTIGSTVIYFAGDTGYGEFFSQIGKRCAAPRLALISIGAYEPQWFMRPVHLTPADALQAHRDLGAGTSVAIHHGTFKLADDGMEQPVVELRGALERSGVGSGEFVILDNGQSHTLLE